MKLKIVTLNFAIYVLKYILINHSLHTCNSNYFLSPNPQLVYEKRNVRQKMANVTTEVCKEIIVLIGQLKNGKALLRLSTNANIANLCILRHVLLAGKLARK
jgi:hypothetical protein